MEADDSPSGIDNVMILMMGENHEHAITSIQRFTPDAVHIVTSDKFEKSYKRRLNDWSKKYDFRKGTVQSLDDLFEETALGSLIGCVFNIGGHEFRLSEGEMNTSMWKVGITGGTMLMAAAGTMMASLLDAQAFYVTKPAEGKAIMPNKNIMILPEINTLKILMTLNPIDVEYLVMNFGNEENSLEELHKNTSIAPWMVMTLDSQGILDVDLISGSYQFSVFGIRLLTMLATSEQNKIIQSITQSELEAMKEKADERFEETNYHG